MGEGYLEPGESRHLTLKIDPRELAFWNVASNAWEIAAGEYRVYVGASSRDIRASDTFRVREP